MDTDSINYQISAPLFQAHPTGERIQICFWPCTLQKAEKFFSTPEKECLAVVWVIQTLRPYRQGSHFVFHSYQAYFRWLLTILEPNGYLMLMEATPRVVLLSRWIQKWASKYARSSVTSTNPRGDLDTRRGWNHMLLNIGNQGPLSSPNDQPLHGRWIKGSNGSRSSWVWRSSESNMRTDNWI